MVLMPWPSISNEQQWAKCNEKKKTTNGGSGVQKNPKGIPKVIQLKVCVEQRMLRRNDAAGTRVVSWV